MTALVLYDEACRAVAAARSLDEWKNIRDLAAGMREYARQAKNRQMEIDAAEIRLRAERRLGELMAQHREAGALRPGAPQKTRSLDTDTRAPRVTLVSAGINEPLGDRARKYAAMPADEFERRLDARRALIEKGVSRVPLDLFKAEDKAERRARREADLADRVRALPGEKYGVIFDDPEWRFEVWSRETGLDRAADNHYPTSDLATIAARNVTSIAAPDCAWFRWVTVPFLAHGIRSIEIDGFTYKSSWVWAKDRIGTGYWNRNRHEVLLLAVRGEVPCPAPGRQWDSLLEAPVGAHSAKPECFLEMIEGYFPNVAKIELNRRGPARPGWSAWGNEAEAPPEIAPFQHGSVMGKGMACPVS